MNIAVTNVKCNKSEKSLKMLLNSFVTWSCIFSENSTQNSCSITIRKKILINSIQPQRKLYQKLNYIE